MNADAGWTGLGLDAVAGGIVGIIRYCYRQTGFLDGYIIWILAELTD